MLCGKWDELVLDRISTHFLGFFFVFPFTKRLSGQETVMFKDVCEKLTGKRFICTFSSLDSGDENLSPD